MKTAVDEAKRELTADNFGLVPVAFIGQLWPQIQQLLVKHGEEFFEVYSLEEVFRELCNGTMDCWAAGEEGVFDGVVLCQWEIHANASFYHILFCCGSNLYTYMDYGLRKLEQFACLKGARDLVLSGRPGWQRVLRSKGYKIAPTRMKKSVRVLWSN